MKHSSDSRSNATLGSRNASEGHRQFESWLPFILVKLNLARTRELIPELVVLSPRQKLERAIDLFEQLLTLEPDDVTRASRQWSLEYFQACMQGHNQRRQFLVEEGVFSTGEILRCPERVRPQMEIANLNPRCYPASLQQELQEVTRLMFFEYFGVKNVLSFPETADIIASLSLRIPALRSVKLPEPRLKPSLLLMDYVRQILIEARKVDGPPLIVIFGPGKGEELVPLITAGFSVLCFDAHDSGVLIDMFKATFRQAAIPAPQFRSLGSGEDVDASDIRAWKDSGYPATVFVHSGTNVAGSDAVPTQLYEVGRVAASIYLMHEIVQKETLCANMALVSRDAVVIFDGHPATAPFDNIVLPVSERSETPLTGHDAVVTHLLCLVPEEMKAVARKAVPELAWESMVVGSPLPPPFIHKQQGAVIGRR